MSHLLCYGNRMDLSQESHLAIDHVSEILHLQPSSIRKAVERGSIPEPAQRTPHMEWAASEFWHWYYLTMPRHYDPSLIPFKYWPAEKTARPDITYSPDGVTVTFKHSLGEVDVIYPLFGGPDPKRNPDRIQAVVKSGVGLFGFDVLVYLGHGRKERVSTITLAVIFDQKIPYWPSGLRYASAAGQSKAKFNPLAYTPENRDALITLQGVITFTDAPLRGLLEQHVRALHYEGYSLAESDLGYADGRIGESLDPFDHLDIQARPHEVPETHMPDWEKHKGLVIGGDALATTAVKAARQSWGSGLNGERYLVTDDVPDEAGKEFINKLTPVPSSETTLGHLFLSEGEQYYVHSDHPEIIASTLHSGATTLYLAPKIIGPVSEDALLDLIDTTNPFVLHEGNWLPVPQHSWSGVNAGYQGTGPKALAEVVLSARRGLPSTGRLITCPILEDEQCPRHITVGEVLNNIIEKGATS